MPWDGYGNALYAQAHGFETYHKPVEGSLVNYENLDNVQTGIHDYFKFLKYGFGRATDLACLHVRRGRLRRDEAIRLVRRHDGKFPVGLPGHAARGGPRRHRHDARRVRPGLRPLHEQEAVRLRCRGELVKDRAAT